MQVTPAKTHKELFKQFNCLLDMYNRTEEMFYTQQNKLEQERQERKFLSQILDDIADVVLKTTGHVWHEDVYYDSLFDLFRDTVGVEFGEGEANDSTIN